MPRLNLTAREAELITAFRTERNIYNSALADVIKMLTTSKDRAGFPLMPKGTEEYWTKEILALRKED